MQVHFFLVLCAFLAVPALLSRLQGSERLLPAVFIQLLCGVAIQLSGLSDWLQAQGVHLLGSPLSASVQGIGWLGIALLVALAGSEAIPAQGERLSWQFVGISVGGFGVTLAAGTALGLALLQTDPALAGPKATPLIFALGMGTCLAVTALPVLFAILEERALSKTPVGRLAALSALLDDLWLWLGLTVILFLAGLQGSHPLLVLALLCGYFLVMFGVVRPWLQRMQATAGASSQGALAGVCVILLSASATEVLGVHAMLGAFIGGAVLPRSAVQAWGPEVLRVSRLLLLPVFFVSTGLRLQVDLSDPHFWFLVAVFSLTAVGVKMLTVTLIGRSTGLAWSHCLLLGTLMQCKGLMELVAINILHDAGIIDTQTYSALAAMALISTLITAPLLRVWAGSRSSAQIRGTPRREPRLPAA